MILDCQDVPPHDVVDMSRSRAPQSIPPQLRLLVLERQRFLAHSARRLGATRTEFDAVDELSQRGGLTPGELGERLSLTSGSVTALVDRMERLGWADRECHPDDRRKVVVRLSELGEEIAEHEIGPLDRVIDRAAAGFPVRDRLVIEQFLAKAAHAAAQLVDTERASGDAPDVAE